MQKNKIKILAILGRSGSGKNYTKTKLMEHYPEMYEIIPITTRPQREGEIEGIDYRFISSNEYAQLLHDDVLLEGTVFNGWGYGTAMKDLSEDKINIGIFNTESIQILLENTQLDVQVIYLQCNEKERIVRQVNRDGQLDMKEIYRRYQAEQQDFSELDRYLKQRNISPSMMHTDLPVNWSISKNTIENMFY